MNNTFDIEQIHSKINLFSNTKLFSKTNQDYAKFIVNVLESFIKRENNLQQNFKNTHIILKENISDNLSNVIDLDSLWIEPYLYTRMRVQLDKLIDIVLSTPDTEIIKKQNKFFKKAIYNKETKKFIKPENKTDITDFIRTLPSNTNYILENDFIFTCEQINEESLFKEIELIKSIKMHKIPDKSMQNKAIYDEICSYLKQDFIENCYCDFINNKCIAQRHLNMYPLYRKNGCCFTNLGPCKKLVNHSCTVKCLPCILFSCPYLTKMGITYWATEFVLLKAFFSQYERHTLVYEFFKSEDEILKRLRDLQK